MIILIQFPWFQTWVAGIAANQLGEALGTTVTIESVNLEFFDKLSFTDLYIEDLEGDTLLYAPSFLGTVNDYSLSEKRLHFGEVKLENARVELKKYPDKDHLNFQFIIDYFSSDEVDTTSSKWNIKTDQISFANTHFSMQDLNVDTFHTGLNFHDMDLKPLTIKFSDFAMDGDSIGVKIADFATKDKRGFEVSSLSADLAMSPKGIHLDSFKLVTPHSDLDADLAFLTESYASYGQFLDSVDLDVDFRETDFQLKDLAWFVPSLHGFDKNVHIRSGNITQAISNVRGRKMDIKVDENTEFQGGFTMQGLPDIENTYIQVNAENVTTHHEDLARIQLPPYDEENYLEVPSQVVAMGPIKMKGTFEGFTHDFVAHGKMRSDLGLLITDVKMLRDSLNQFRYSGELDAEEFSLGRLLGVEGMERVTGSFVLDKGIGLEPARMYAQGRGDIARLTYNGYTYHNLTVDGGIKSGHFIGDVISRDPNLDLVFNGTVDFAKRIPEMKFDAVVTETNLVKLNFIERDSSSKLTARFHLDLKGNHIDNLQGDVFIDSFFYKELGDTFSLGELTLNAIQDTTYKELDFNSSLIDAEIKGQFNFGKLPANFQLIASTIMPSLFPNVLNDEALQAQQFEYDVTVKDFEPITRLFLPDLHIAQNTNVFGNYDSRYGSIHVAANSDQVNYGSTRITYPSLEIFNTGGHIEMSATAAKIHLTDSATVDNVEFDAFAIQDDLRTFLSWHDDNNSTFGELSGILYVNGRDDMEFELMPSFVNVEKMHWDVFDNAIVSMRGKTIEVENFLAENGNQSLTIGGKLSEIAGDKMEITFEDFYLNNLNPLLSAAGLQMQGILNGSGYISDFYKGMVFESEYTIDAMMLNEARIGEVLLKSEFDPGTKRVVVEGNIERDGIKNLTFDGDYSPTKETESLNLALHMNRTDLDVINAFMPLDVAHVDGYLDGEMTITGTPSVPVMKGKVLFNNTIADIVMTNTRYRINGEVEIEPDMIMLNWLPVTDINGNVANVTGTLYHTNFADMNFDLALFLDNFYCLNTTEEMNSLYYGQAYATGDVFVFGDIDALEIDVNVKNEAGTVINLPLSGSTEVEESDFVTYYGSKNPKPTKAAKPDLTGIQMNFNMDVNPGANFRLIFDEKVGDIMQATGSGNIKMDINTVGTFKMTGEYEVDHGDYLFTLENVINKKFEVLDGGTIQWTGDPYQGDMKLQTVYKLKTTLYDLMLGTGEADKYHKRIPVELVMNITEKLMAPQIAFAIVMPTVDEQTRNQVASILNSEQELNRQAFSLLMLKKFMPPGSFEAGNVVGSSTTEMLANQFNNMIGPLIKGADIGLDYNAGDEVSGSEIAVAVEKTIFNDRLTVSGNIGVSGSSDKHVVGDFALEYQMDDEGYIHARAFNESNNDNFSNSDKGPYTQGVGMTYSEEYDKLHQITLLDGLFNAFRGKNNPKKIEYKERRKAKKEKKQREKEKKIKRKEDNIARYNRLIGNSDEEEIEEKEPNPDGNNSP